MMETQIQCKIINQHSSPVNIYICRPGRGKNVVVEKYNLQKNNFTELMFPDIDFIIEIETIDKTKRNSCCLRNIIGTSLTIVGSVKVYGEHYSPEYLIPGYRGYVYEVYGCNLFMDEYTTRSFITLIK